MNKACAWSRTALPPSLIALAVLLPLSACGSSGSAARAATAGAPGASATTCEQVSAVLADGPDSDTDPLGYAEAQIQPLRQIHTADAGLGQAVSALATAYSGYYTANGASKTATATLTGAIKQINKLCPGLGATP